MSNELHDPQFDSHVEFIPIKNKGKRGCCPLCFKPYELIDNELVQTCFHPQNSNICGRHGLDNHNCGS